MLFITLASLLDLRNIPNAGNKTMPLWAFQVDSSGKPSEETVPVRTT